MTDFPEELSAFVIRAMKHRPDDKTDGTEI
jgi:hypothetical protein